MRASSGWPSSGLALAGPHTSPTGNSGTGIGSGGDAGDAVGSAEDISGVASSDAEVAAGNAWGGGFGAGAGVESEPRIVGVDVGAGIGF